jgi:hypothetical protein
MRRIWLALLVALSVAPVSRGDELDAKNQWPHWRGPLATGVAPHANPPAKWDATTNVRWKAPLPGRGSSTPSSTISARR